MLLPTTSVPKESFRTLNKNYLRKRIVNINASNTKVMVIGKDNLKNYAEINNVKI